MLKTALTLAAVTFATLGSAAEAADCSGQARAPWTSAGKGYAVAATARGRTCARAAVSLAIVGPHGKTLHRYSAPAGQNFEFHDVRTKAAMSKALARLVAGGSNWKTSADLPDWTDKDSQPGGGREFPFYVEDGMSRDAYLAIRKANRPLFCYVQGMESTACVVLRANGAVQKVGAQSFPG